MKLDKAVEEIEDLDPIRDGKFKEWWPNDKKKAEGIYKNNKIDGEYKEWDEKGKLIIHAIYKDGKKVNNI